MSRALSSTFVEAVNAAETDEAFLILVTIDHADMAAPIRVTSDAVTTFAAGQDSTIAKDSTSNDNDGTLVNGPAWGLDTVTAGIVGALSFDGVDDYVVTNGAPDASSNNASNEFTVEFWWAPDADHDDGPIVEWNFVGGGGSAHIWSRGSGTMLLNPGSGSVHNASGVVIEDGIFRHYAVVFDGPNDVIRMYRGGSEVFNAADTGTANTTGDSIRIGRRENGSREIKGSLSDVRIWNTARTQQQIQDNMNVRLNGDEAGLVGYWRLDDSPDKYLPFPFKVSLPDDSDEASGVLSKLTIDAVDRRVVEAARSITGVPSVDLEVVLASDPDATEVAWPTFKMANVRYDTMTIEGDLVLEPLDQEPLPSAKFDPARFPGIF